MGQQCNDSVGRINQHSEYSNMDRDIQDIERLIWSIVVKYPENARCGHEDLFNVGLFTAHRVKEDFKPDQGVKFATFAYKAIENAIMQEWRNSANVLNCSSYLIKSDPEIEKHNDFVNKTIVSLDVKSEDMVETSGVGKTFPSGSRNSWQNRKKLYEIIVASGEGDPEAAAERHELIQQVDNVIDSLEPIDREIIHRRFFEDQTFQQIATDLDLSWRQVNYRFSKLQGVLKDKLVEAGLDTNAS